MKRVSVSVALVLLLLGMAVPASAGCLNAYNNALRYCDAMMCPVGPFTCAGCYADALTDYYGCIEQQAVN